jgi:VanZ family protein
MKESSPTLKNRKPSVYVFFALYCLFGALILGESAVPSNASGTQSNTFSSILASIVNFFNPPSVGKVIEPKSLELQSDSTFLSPEEDLPRIALGTTSLITYQLSYPDKGDPKDSFDQNFTVTASKGTEGSDFSIARSINNSTNVISLRINAMKISSDPFEVTIKAGGAITSSYRFKVCDLLAPTSYTVANAPTASVSLARGMSYPLSIVLEDPRSSISEASKKNDHDLRRYFDPTKLAYTSSDPNLSVDSYGVVRALGPFSNGNTASVTVGGDANKRYSFTYDAATSAVQPTSLTLTSSGATYLTDYDFFLKFKNKYTAKDENYQDYSAVVKASFGSNVPSDKGVTFVSLDPLAAKIIPYSYDETTKSGSYFDESGEPACRVQGYRKAGEVQIKAIANADANLTSTISLPIAGAPAKAMFPSTVDDRALNTNNQLFLTANFSPTNTADSSILVTSSNTEVASVSNSGTTSVTLTALSRGTSLITITSVSNPSLTSSFHLNVTDPGLINDSNFNSFAAFTRKAAGHFTLFLVTAIIGLIFFNLFFADPKKDWLGLTIGAGIGFLLAAFSEMIQYLGNLWFQFGRSGSWADIGTDTLGYVVGALLTWGVILLIRLIKKKKAAKAPSQNSPTA